MLSLIAKTVQPSGFKEERAAIKCKLSVFKQISKFAAFSKASNEMEECSCCSSVRGHTDVVCCKLRLCYERISLHVCLQFKMIGNFVQHFEPYSGSL